MIIFIHIVVAKILTIVLPLLISVAYLSINLGGLVLKIIQTFVHWFSGIFLQICDWLLESKIYECLDYGLGWILSTPISKQVLFLLGVTLIWDFIFFIFKMRQKFKKRVIKHISFKKKLHRVKLKINFKNTTVKLFTMLWPTLLIFFLPHLLLLPLFIFLYFYTHFMYKYEFNFYFYRLRRQLIRKINQILK